MFREERETGQGGECIKAAPPTGVLDGTGQACGNELWFHWPLAFWDSVSVGVTRCYNTHLIQIKVTKLQLHYSSVGIN